MGICSGISTNWNLELMLVCGGRKTGDPGKKLLEQGQEPTTNSTHIQCTAWTPGFKPGPQWRFATYNPRTVHLELCFISYHVIDHLSFFLLGERAYMMKQKHGQKL